MINIEKEIYSNLASEALRLLQKKINSGDLNYDALKKISMVIFRCVGKLQISENVMTKDEYEKFLHACGIISISDSRQINITKPAQYENLCVLETYLSFGKSNLLSQNSLA